MTEIIMVQLIGFCAGTIVCLSALPRVVDIYRNRDVALGESLIRNCALSVGNLLWVVYGLLLQAPAIAIMCFIGAMLNSVILFASIKARWKYNAI